MLTLAIAHGFVLPRSACWSWSSHSTNPQDVHDLCWDFLWRHHRSRTVVRRDNPLSDGIQRDSNPRSRCVPRIASVSREGLAKGFYSGAWVPRRLTPGRLVDQWRVRLLPPVKRKTQNPAAKAPPRTQKRVKMGVEEEEDTGGTNQEDEEMESADEGK
ncbi:hypothetical protein DFH09DRAFT_208984 [Mycena vulgaris]|nr:hypothetical protein DFH09DRAFT_208984 [Mycena vulgaris]